MSHYKANVRDLQFNLFELLQLEKVLATGEFGDIDATSAREMLAAAAELAEGPLAAAFTEGDRTPPTFDSASHSVSLPEAFKTSVRSWLDAGWSLMGLHDAIGGVRAPAMMTWAIMEFLVGAQPAAFFYLVGPPILDVLYQVGNEQQRHWAVQGVQRNWGATMVLTEPDAGSDVGAARTRAVPQSDGSWHIEGVKRFISGADSDDLFENIAHLVLARPVGAQPGTKGLSLFLVPKFMPDPESGEPCQRNGVFATAIEHKLGLTAAVTCDLAFGQHGTPAVGWLVGDTHNGIAQMFKILQYARMMIGIKSISTLSTSYFTTLEYAKARVQGPDQTQMADAAAPRVTLIHHPDVRRSLLIQKAYAEGLRAMYLYAGAHQDPVAAELISGASAEMGTRVNDLLLPLVKGAGSERAYQCLVESVQTLGGAGYLKDYPVEQYLRDAKIDSLYEGTTGMQANDLFFRKILRDRGETFTHVTDQISGFLDGARVRPELTTECSVLRCALDDVTAMVTTLMERHAGTATDERQIYLVGLRSVALLLAVADLVIGWLLLWQADIALAALDNAPDERERVFYEGKVGVARFFAETVLPRLAAERRSTELQTLAAMDLAEDAF
ncbi:MAG: acyl-CoA dehydrogenase domain protein [Mycobacterium sp.]|nr:acyl-CoA dehydrogenase domain protein [Mycobacterium sp.]